MGEARSGGKWTRHVMTEHGRAEPTLKKKTDKRQAVFSLHTQRDGATSCTNDCGRRREEYDKILTD